MNNNKLIIDIDFSSIGACAIYLVFNKTFKIVFIYVPIPHKIQNEKKNSLGKIIKFLKI